MNFKAKRTILVSVILLLVLSVFLPVTGADKNTSDTLQTVTTRTDSETRVDYVDSSGEITTATDKGYATIIKKIENGHNVEEFYYDENGEPAKSSSGNYGLARVWSGKQCVKITWLDESGQPMYNTSGYVSRLQEYNDAGKVSKEFYLGLDDEPTANKRGEYGRAYEYDEEGHKYKVTILNEAGEPSLNTSGYCTLVRTYKDDDSVNTVMYYGVDGEPVQLSGGQYGIKYVNGKTAKLNQYGQIANIDEVLKVYPWFPALIGVAFVGLVICLPLKWSMLFTALYILFILYKTLFIRETGDVRLELTPFWSYRQFFTSYTLRIEILNNIWLFVPFGAGLYSLIHRCRLIKKNGAPGQPADVVLRLEKCRIPTNGLVLLTAPALSLLIEATQYVFALGLCEVDDLISNTLGAALGMGLAVCAPDLFRAAAALRHALTRAGDGTQAENNSGEQKAP